jgi:hypothetical protein
MISTKAGHFGKKCPAFAVFIARMGKNADFGWKHGAKWCIIEPDQEQNKNTRPKNKNA